MSSSSSVVVESTYFGVFTALIFISTWILVRKGLNSRPSKAMLAATLIMYAAATAHWAFVQSDEDETDQCTPTALLSVNIILSNTIVLWRAWILRSGRVFRTVSIFLLLGTIILSIAGTVQNCGLTTSSDFEVNFVSAFTDTVWGLSLFPFSWTTNVWATSVIGHKAWQHRRLVRDYIQHGNARTRAEKAMALFVDSGLSHCILWTFLTVQAFLQAFTDLESNTTVGDTLVDGGLIQLLGIYPTVVVIFVCLDVTHCDRNFTYSKPTQAPPEIPLRRITAAQDAITSRAETQDESILLIGDGSSIVGSSAESDENEDHDKERRAELENTV